MENRHQDILDLLLDVHDIINQLESKIEKAGSDNTTKEVFRPRIKSALEQFRSCLDYCARRKYLRVSSEKHS